MTELMVIFCNFVNGPKNRNSSMFVNAQQYIPFLDAVFTLRVSEI